MSADFELKNAKISNVEKTNRFLLSVLRKTSAIRVLMLGNWTWSVKRGVQLRSEIFAVDRREHDEGSR